MHAKVCSSLVWVCANIFLPSYVFASTAVMGAVVYGTEEPLLVMGECESTREDILDVHRLTMVLLLACRTHELWKPV